MDSKYEDFEQGIKQNMEAGLIASDTYLGPVEASLSTAAIAMHCVPLHRQNSRIVTDYYSAVRGMAAWAFCVTGDCSLKADVVLKLRCACRPSS